jgi:hypothetical protein
VAGIVGKIFDDCSYAVADKLGPQPIAQVHGRTVMKNQSRLKRFEAPNKAAAAMYAHSTILPDTRC